jgi:hypothetical protein
MVSRADAQPWACGGLRKHTWSVIWRMHRGPAALLGPESQEGCPRVSATAEVARELRAARAAARSPGVGMAWLFRRQAASKDSWGGVERWRGRSG